jgi:hypothetical protein
MWFSTAGRVPRILRACAVGAGLVTFTAGAQAQSAADKYPDKPIKIIVPFAPGGSTDILARVIGQKMTESWGQTVIVETRPGAATRNGGRLRSRRGAVHMECAPDLAAAGVSGCLPRRAIDRQQARHVRSRERDAHDVVTKRAGIRKRFFGG